jgi:ethanolamine utilization protein EutA
MHDEHDDFHGAGGGLDSVDEVEQEGEDVEGLEMFTLRSVGIDIGSSTSHLIFSQIVLRREGAGLSARFTVTDRTVLHRSAIMLTPYVSGTLIDHERLKEFILEAYREAGFTPRDIDTGAVIITGEALKKENARPIAEFFARESGGFICASAGPNHEALLAAYGSGAVALSKANRSTVLNVDVGGGTAKLSVVRDGEVMQTAALNVGARLLAFDDEGRVARVEDAAHSIMREAGGSVDLEIGSRLSDEQQARFADLMAQVLFEVIEGGALSELTRELLITEPLSEARLDEVEQLLFSGGVSEYIYERDQTGYGDLGALFGWSIRQRLAQLPRQGLLAEPVEGIRATVIGAGEYTIQVSGTTSYVSNVGALPTFGLQVVRLALDDGQPVEQGLQRALSKFDLSSYQSGLALALSLKEPPDYQGLRRIAEGIYNVVQAGESDGQPLFLILDMDLAKSLGGILKEELKLEPELVAIDGIDVGDLDYVDVGRPMGILEPLPVTVKSLLFPSDAQKASDISATGHPRR